MMREFKTWMSAHRGGAALAPENTLASFRNGLKFHPDFLEMDVHLTKDGVPVVIHDGTIDRTTNGSGRVVNYTLVELQGFNAAAKFSGGDFGPQVIPSFAQVLDLVKDTGVRVEVEIKPTADVLRYNGIEQKVLDELAARGMLDRARIMAFEFDTLLRAKEIQPNVQTIALLSLAFLGNTTAYQPVPALDYIATIGVDGIGVNKDLVKPELVDEAHRRGMRVGLWTVDSEEEIKKFIGMGVDSITTNRPDVLSKILGR
jgi:glycerophosphoryl diester phosphodiesterase